MKPLLAIDIGNSTTGFCLFPDSSDGTFFYTARIASSAARGISFYKKNIIQLIRRHTACTVAITDAVLSSVVPELTEIVADAVKSVCGIRPLIISHKLSADITFKVGRPAKVGSDRIANAAAAWQYTKADTIIIDFGTATTVTVIDMQRNFLGGAILPGLSTMAASLGVRAAQLPKVDIKAAGRALGGDTSSAILSGILFGTAGAAEKIVKNIEKEQGFKVKLILTGGNSEIISPLIQKKHKLIPNLLFEGLRIIYLRSLGDRGKRI